ncbi:NAD(P)H-hydrate epimerase [Ditylenchus destructor]|nr:NAD(P)H-hydrate epimerase [Ditylenchus destructor]
MRHGVSYAPGIPGTPEPAKHTGAAGWADIVIDALLGLGASRPPDGEFAAAIRAINASRHKGAIVLAVDPPAGWTSAPDSRSAPTSVRADHTLSFLMLKAGLFTGEGRALAGRIWLDDLDTRWARTALHRSSAPLTSRAGSAPTSARPPAHGRNGDVVVLGGAPRCAAPLGSPRPPR